MRFSYRAVFFWILALGWIGVLFYFSGQDGVRSSAMSSAFTDWLRQVLPFLNRAGDRLELVLRKLAHFGIFAVEGFLLALAVFNSLRRPRRLAGALAFAACAIMAAANEYHESFFAGRSCEFRDVLIDSAGALLGVLAAALIFSLVRRIRARV